MTGYYDVITPFELPTERVRYALPKLHLASSEAALFYGASVTRPGDLVLALAGAVPEDGYPEPPTGDQIRQTIRSIDTASFPLSINGNPVYGSVVSRQLIGQICSNPDLNILGRTVLEDYLNALVSVGRSPEQQVAVLDLRPFDLDTKVNRRTDRLSGGEKQRLNCATAFTGRRDLLALDFSAMSLDFPFREFFLQMANQFCSIGGIVLAAGITSEDATELSSAKVRRFVLKTLEDDLVEVAEASPDSTEFPNLQDEITGLKIIAVRILGNPIVNVQDVNRRDITVGTTFVLHEREIIVVTGDNGIGKTTLGQILVGRLPKKDIDGTLTTYGPVRPVMASQFPDSMLVTLSLAEELPDKELREICGLDAHDDKVDPRELDYGSRKLLGIAKALRLSRGFAVLDEPTCGLDFDQKQRVMRLIDHYPELAVVVFTHDTALLGLGFTQHEMKRS